MRVGVNFAWSPACAIGFDDDAVRALRPAIVRVSTERPADIRAWIAAAARARLQLLWTIPVERLTTAQAVHAAKEIARCECDYGLQVAAGVELGAAPWKAGMTPARYVEAITPVITTLHRGVSDRLWSRDRPILLGAGYDGSPQASAWLKGLVKDVWRHVHALSCHAVTPGRPIRRFIFRGLQSMAADRGVALSFTRAGWDLGERLTWWTRWKETITAAWRMEELDPAESGVVTPALRRTWLLEAAEFAAQLGALHFLVETEPVASGNWWSLYRVGEGRPDPTWIALQWRDARWLAQHGRAAAMPVM